MRQLKIAKQITNRDAPSLDYYLSEISRESLLTGDQEIGLMLRIKKGDEQAFQLLIKSNLRFVVSVAKQYQGKGLSLPDLINEGNLGLIKAAQRFDHTRGFKFISYAVWWIRQAILQAIAENSRLVRIPMNQVGMLVKVKKAFKTLEQQYQRNPATEEIAELLQFQIKVVEDALQIPNYHMSLDEQAGDGEEYSLYDVMVNEDSLSPDSQMLSESLKIDIENILRSLSVRQANIICMYFGLRGEKAIKIEEIAIRVGITSQRIRQIKEGVICKLKIKHKNSMLRQYFE